jgi:hypothetical protein
VVSDYLMNTAPKHTKDPTFLLQGDGQAVISRHSDPATAVRFGISKIYGLLSSIQEISPITAFKLTVLGGVPMFDEGQPV